MDDREIIVKWFEFCRVEDKCSTDCPYFGNTYSARECTNKLAKDVLSLLKEQKAVKPHYNARTNLYECGACHYSMTSGMHCRSELIPATKVRYCANCGFPVNWEGR